MIRHEVSYSPVTDSTFKHLVCLPPKTIQTIQTVKYCLLLHKAEVRLITNVNTPSLFVGILSCKTETLLKSSKCDRCYSSFATVISISLSNSNNNNYLAICAPHCAFVYARLLGMYPLCSESSKYSVNQDETSSSI